MKFNLPYKRTKIIATVGPACNTKEKLRELAKAGVDVFRLNFSHGTHEDHAKVIKFIREVNEEEGFNIAILQDLQGPKIRTNQIENGEVDVVPGQKITITTKDIIGTKESISTSYTSLADDVKKGDTILIDDGKIELVVDGAEGTDVICEVVHGGPIKSRKGINLPDTNVSSSSLTEKDLKDLAFGLENNVHWIALSFVRQAEDVVDLKSRIAKAGKSIKVISKIEKPQAVENIDDIIEVSDALMVARGDLGVEVIMEEVPMIQKMIVKKCTKNAIPVIIATQMMESMITNPRPTRAETNDVANAVMDGADTVMLSAETAAGKFPLESVRSMSRTIRIVESQSKKIYNRDLSGLIEKSSSFVNDSLVKASTQLAKNVNAKAIIGITESGYTAFRLSSHRPKSRIYIFTANKRMLNTLNLVWGVKGFYYDSMVSTDQTIADLENILRDEGLLHEGDVFITMGSMPVHEKQRTNMMKINVVKP